MAFKIGYLIGDHTTDGEATVGANGDRHGSLAGVVYSRTNAKKAQAS
jgi:hypothetical protein